MGSRFFDGARITWPEHLGALPLSTETFSIVGIAERLIEQPDPSINARTLVLDVEVDDFRVRVGDYRARVFTTVFATNVATIVDHGFATGDGPFQLTTVTTLPDPLALLTNFWVVRIDDDDFKFATSFENAVAVVPVVVDLTDDGTGDHTLGGLPILPAADVDDGYSSILLTVGRYVISAPNKLTVKGGDAAAVLNYWWLP